MPLFVLISYIFLEYKKTKPTKPLVSEIYCIYVMHFCLPTEADPHTHIALMLETSTRFLLLGSLPISSTDRRAARRPDSSVSHTHRSS